MQKTHSQKTHLFDNGTMAYTACFKLPDNGIVKLETSNDVDKVDCEKCIDAILAEWEAKDGTSNSH